MELALASFGVCTFVFQEKKMNPRLVAESKYNAHMGVCPVASMCVLAPKRFQCRRNYHQFVRNG